MLGRRFVSKQLGPAFATPINRGYRPACMAKAKTALDREFKRKHSRGSGLSQWFPVKVKLLLHFAAAQPHSSTGTASGSAYGQHPNLLHKNFGLKCTQGFLHATMSQQRTCPAYLAALFTPCFTRHLVCDEQEPDRAWGTFLLEAGRYHLYISYACPWACKTVAAMHVKVGPTDSLCVRSDAHWPLRGTYARIFAAMLS